MLLKEAEQILDGFVYGLATTLGFRRIEAQRFECHVYDAAAHLSFPCRVSAEGGGLFTAWVGLRFEAIARWLDDDSAEMRSTVGMPIHFLRPDRTFTEWEFSNANDLARQREMILDDLQDHALPYIEQYSRLADLRRALESRNKQDWFATGLNVDSRVSVLAAIQFVEGEKEAAITTLDNGLRTLRETLDGRFHELRKRSFAMEYLRDRLIKNC